MRDDSESRVFRRFGRVASSLILAGFAIGGCTRQARVESGPAVGGPDGLRESALVADLRRLSDLQAEHRESNPTYSYELEALGFSPTVGVQMDVLEASADGFSAIATGGGHECVLFEGTARPPRSYSEVPGDVECRR